MPVETSEYWRIRFQRNIAHKALIEYAMHKNDDCMWHFCSCGLNDVLDSLDPLPDEDACE